MFIPSKYTVLQGSKPSFDWDVNTRNYNHNLWAERPEAASDMRRATHTLRLCTQSWPNRNYCHYCCRCRAWWQNTPQAYGTEAASKVQSATRTQETVKIVKNSGDKSMAWHAAFELQSSCKATETPSRTLIPTIDRPWISRHSGCRPTPTPSLPCSLHLHQATKPQNPAPDESSNSKPVHRPKFPHWRFSLHCSVHHNSVKRRKNSSYDLIRPNPSHNPRGRHGSNKKKSVSRSVQSRREQAHEDSSHKYEKIYLAVCTIYEWTDSEGLFSKKSSRWKKLWNVVDFVRTWDNSIHLWMNLEKRPICLQALKEGPEAESSEATTKFSSTCGEPSTGDGLGLTTAARKRKHTRGG